MGLTYGFKYILEFQQNSKTLECTWKLTGISQYFVLLLNKFNRRQEKAKR